MEGTPFLCKASGGTKQRNKLQHLGLSYQYKYTPLKTKPREKHIFHALLLYFFLSHIMTSLLKYTNLKSKFAENGVSESGKVFF